MPVKRKRASTRVKATDWSSALSGFLAHLEAREKTACTIRGYRGDLLAFTAWYQQRFGERPVPALVLGDELREYKAHLRDDRKLQPASVNRKLAALASFFTWCHGAGACPELEQPRPIDQVVLPPRWLEERHQRALIRELSRQSRRDAAIVLTLLDAGLRVDELATLERRNLEIHDRSGSVKVIGKGRKQRTVELGPRVRAALRSYLADRKDSNPAVFLGQRGAMGVRAVQLVVEKIGRKAAIGDLSPHMLRHSYGHNLAVKGVRLEVIADLMGHESLDVTRRYVQPGQAERAAAVERLGGGEE